MTVASGAVDLHIHGAFGVDVLTAQEPDLDRLSRELEARGVTGFLPTLVPLPLPDLKAAVSRLSAWIRTRRNGDGRGALPLGLHFEGPFVSPVRAGALNRKLFLDGSDPARLDAFFAALGDLPGRSMITLAPEIPGGIGLVGEFARRGFVVSIGHTDAEAVTLEKAFEAGARHMTHFANAMRPLHHREPGPVGWGLVNDGVTVDVIGDLHHLAPGTLRLVFRSKGASRVALISDAIPAAGRPEGEYVVWGERLTVRGGAVRNPAGKLAGSVCLIDEARSRLAAIGFSPEELRLVAEEVPRRILGLA